MMSWKKETQFLAASVSLAAILLAGCTSAGVNSSTGGVAITGAATTSTSPLFTDAPGDQVLALGLTVTGIRMFDAKGNYADVLTAPTQVEALHLDAQQEPLRASLNIPQDTYTSATIAVANPMVTYVDTSTKQVVHTVGTLAAGTTTVTFNAPIAVTATSAPILFDLLVGQSVAITGTGSTATVTVTPMFNVTQIPLAQQPTNPGNGFVAGIVGSVASVSGTSLTITEPNGQSVTVATNSSTVLQGFSSLASLTAGEMVDLDVAQQTNGTLLALRIHLLPAAAASYLAGPVTAVTGKPVTSFTQTVRQALGSSTSGLTAGPSVTVAVTSGTQFLIAPQAGNVPALPFTPVFSASNMIAGQNVGVAASAVSGTTATASQVALLPQTVEGTVASVTTAGGVTVYTVTLPSGSALGTLSGASTVVVYEPTGAQVQGSTTLAVGASIRVNGLLFNDSGTLRMVALLRCDPSPSAPVQHH